MTSPDPTAGTVLGEDDIREADRLGKLFDWTAEERDTVLSLLAVAREAGREEVRAEATRWRQLYEECEQRSERWRGRAETAEAKVRAVERIRMWTNEDHKGFLFADDVREALGIPT